MDQGELAVFGRELELDFAERFLDRASERFSALRLDGEVGIGKTTIWREVVNRAESRGFRVLSSQPAEAETKLALSAVFDLLEAVDPENLSSLPEPQQHALEVALLRAEPEDVQSDPRALATGLRNLLAALSTERPVLVAIDDVHWLDPSSASLLGFALRRLISSRVSWLFSARLPDPAGLADDAVVPSEELTVLTLGPLTLAAFHHMLKDRLTEPLSRPDLVRLHEAAAGNPLFALEIARAGRPIGPAPAGLPVPDRLRDLLARRIPELPSEATDALIASAALSQPTVELVEQASSASAITSAEETGLIRVDERRISFTHPLYASAIYESSAVARRRDLHEQLAELVADPEERARHLAAAAAGPSEDVAQALEDAAILARRRASWEAASELLERASGLTPMDRRDERDRRLISAAEHQIHAGGRSRARSLLERALANELPRPVRAEALRLLGEVAWHDDDFAEALRALTEALDYAEEPHLLSQIELALGWMQPTFSDYSGGAPLAHRALQHAQEDGDQSLIASALALRAQLGFLKGNGVDWEMAERSVALEDHEAIIPMMWQPSAVRALLELWVGRIADARGHLSAVRVTASERGDESDLAFLELWLSWLEVKSGNFALAASLAEEMASSAGLSGSKALQAYALGQRAFVHAHRGEVAETRALAAEATEVNKLLQQPQVMLWTASALSLLELSRGDPNRAWDACEPIAQAYEQEGIAEPASAVCLPETIEAMIALGELDRAEALLDAFEGRAQELDRPWALATGGRCRGLLLAARGDLPGSTAAVAAALTAHDRVEMPLDLGRTLLVQGVVERRARRRRRARQSLERALAIFEEVEAGLWAERARKEIARLGMPRSEPDELTEAERRVAEAAGGGMTNREVAATLYLSPKTVEAHLSSVYRKLGISSRAELGARMATDPQN